MRRSGTGGHVLRLALIGFAWILAGCTRVSEPTNPKQLAEQFEVFFGFKPPPSVTEIRSKSVQIGDSLTDWISFRCDQRVFSQMTNSRDLRVIDAERLSGELEKMARGAPSDIPHLAVVNPNAPRWWPASKEASMRHLFYLPRLNTNQGSPGFPYGYEHYFWRDEASGKVFACYSMSR